MDKTEGLKLTADGFALTIHKFLNNGMKYRLDLVYPIVQRLQEYYDCITQQDRFRFYSSSLLIIYDGIESEGVVDIRAIDFAHTVYPGAQMLQHNAHQGPDEGYLLGIKSLINILSQSKCKQ